MAGPRCPSCDRLLPDAAASCEACAAVAPTVHAAAAPTVAGRGGNHGASGDPLIGTEVIGQYVIRRLLGKGGMGAVYLADQPSVGRRAVIKVLHPALSRDPGLVARFDVEARAASQLGHPNIVTIYNYGAMADGTLFLAMEHLDGQTLEEVIERGRQPVARAVDIVRQAAAALAEAHRRGVVHRDVKPSNVMLVSRGQAEDFVKVLDFGIAHVEGSDMTSTGAICGTPRYMSPEQLRGQKLDGRSDLYSLGCILFELVTGRAPFTAGSPLGLGYQHVHEAAPRASEVAPKARIPAALDAFLARALAKDPADRPRSAEAFLAELRRVVEEPPGPEPAAVAPPIVVAAPAVRTTPPPGRPQKPSLVGRGLRGAAAFARRIVDKVRPRPRPLGARVLARLRGLRAGGRRRSGARWRRYALLSALGLALAGVGWIVVTRLHTEEPALQPAPASAAPTPPREPARPPRRTSRPKARF